MGYAVRRRTAKASLRPARKTSVHPTSVVDEGAILGAGTQVWHFCHIMRGARLGRECRVGQNVFIGKGVRIGDRVKIQNNVSVYTGVTLEDDVFCGPSVVFTNVSDPRSAFPKDPSKGYEPTLVRRGATIGANATIVCGITIGEQAFIGAGAVVTRDVPAFGLVYGNPARLQGWMCRCGARLSLAPVATRATDTCRRCGRTFEQRGQVVVEARAGRCTTHGTVATLSGSTVR